MRHLRWAMITLLAAGLPLSANAGFGFGFSDNGFDTWDPADHPYGYPNRGYDPAWRSDYYRRRGADTGKWKDDAKRRQGLDDWNSWGDDKGSSFSFGSNSFNFGDSWGTSVGDDWGRHRGPYGPAPYGYAPPGRGWGGAYPPSGWTYGRPPPGR
jgi:hypothetical protein